MSITPYKPLLTANQPGGSAIADRNFNDIATTLASVTSSVNNQSSNPVTTQRKSYGVQVNDQTILIIPANNLTVTVTLPDANGAKGHQYTIKNATPVAASTTVTVSAQSKQTIDLNLTPSLTGLQSISIVSDGSNWWII